MYCPVCGKANAPDSRFCPACGAGLRAADRADVSFCPRCNAVMDVADRFCPRCGEGAARPEPPGASAPTPPAAPAPGTHPSRHSPLLALLLGLVVPGAGQAYNGQPVKGFFLFFGSALALPYLFSLYDAYAVAARIRRTGPGSGCAGFLWVLLQFWLAANTALLAVLALSVLGVLT